MLRIAVPNKGSLSEAAAEMLREAGYAVRRDTKELVVADPDNDAEFFYLRPRDIATYVGSGDLDLDGRRTRLGRCAQVGLYSGEGGFNLDFHTIRHHGEQVPL